MRPDTSDAGYLWDMLEAARGTVRAAEGHTFQVYLEDENFRLSVERRIEIIGEAARNVSRSFKQAHPEIPWRGIIAQRHVLAHGYGDIDNELIWNVVTMHVPRLIAALEPLIPPPPPDAGC